jgi:signal peptidase II
MFSNNKKTAFFILLAVFLLALDRFLKNLAIKGYYGKLNILENIFSFNFTPNYNIAFSIPVANLLLLIAIPIIIVILIIVFINQIKNNQKLISWLWLIVILGAASNYFDRIKYGYVIDYFDLKYFTVFNLADPMIVLGIFGIIIKMYYKNKTISS